MRNDVLDPGAGPSVVDDLAGRAVDERRAAYADEVRRLIDAAYAVMRESGDIEPRVGDVVKAAGLSNQAFYRHFASKDALLLAVLTDGRQRLLGTLTARMDRVEPGAPRVPRLDRRRPRPGPERRRRREHPPLRHQRHPHR